LPAQSETPEQKRIASEFLLTEVITVPAIFTCFDPHRGVLGESEAKIRIKTYDLLHKRATGSVKAIKSKVKEVMRPMQE
jgi:hypothetical protein